MSDKNDTNEVQYQDNCPDTRSGLDHQHSTSNPTDQVSTEALNTSNTDIQVHPRSVSPIDAKSIKVPSVSTSPKAQEQSPVSHQPENSPGKRLLDALWHSPDRIHQIGILSRQNNKFKNLPINDATDAVAQAQKLSSDGKEVYIACAEYLTPYNRMADNVSGACALWLDVDCGEDKVADGKGYATVEDAEIALRKYCTDTGLPQPTHIVHSGGGLHVYWVVDSVISPETWQLHARKLKELTKACRFLADDSRTADIASVLRVPGTLNHKYTPPRPVTLEYTADKFIERSVMLNAIADAHDRLCNTAAPMPPGHSPIATDADGATHNNDAPGFGPPDLVKLSSAMATLEPDCDEETWKLGRLAPLAMAARNHPELATALYELARSWSSGELRGKPSKAWCTPGGDGLSGEQAFDAVWKRFLDDHYTGTPITLGTIYHDAMQAGWSDTVATEPSAPAKTKRDNDSDSGSFPFPEVEPCTTPVDPASLLNEIETTIRQYIVMKPEQADAAALWIAFSWCINAVEIAPLAIINAPEKACGKSQLLDVIGRMTARPLPVANVTPAALFRSVERWNPTLLIDEADTFFSGKDELKGLINAGHTRANAFVLRTVGDSHEPKMFKVWGAKALAGISLEKHLPDATLSRAIMFGLRRKLPHEKVSRLRHAEPGLFEGIASKLARFAEDHAQQVRQARPALPDELDDRAQDNWEPLLAIASCAGPDWVSRANKAALKLSGDREETASTGNELLADIQHVFDSKQVERIKTVDLIDALVEDEEKPWATYSHGKPITPRQLSKLLAPYDIRSKTVRFGDRTPKGYEASQFTDAFARYLAGPEDLPQRRNDTPKSNDRMAACDADDVSATPSTGETQEFTRIPGCGGVSDVSGNSDGEATEQLPPLCKPEDLF